MLVQAINSFLGVFFIREYNSSGIGTNLSALAVLVPRMWSKGYPSLMLMSYPLHSDASEGRHVYYLLLLLVVSIQ